MSFVLDASVMFAWQFPDEETEMVTWAIDRLLEKGAVVPVHWCAEIANGFLVAVRRGRMSHDFQRGALSRIPDLDIVTDLESADAFFAQTQEIAVQHGLSAYDAAYLELALRRRLPLATLDQALQAAAKKTNVELIGMAR